MLRKFALVTEYSEDDLKNIILSAVAQALQEFTTKLANKSANSPPHTDYLLSRKQVSKLLNLSLISVAKLQKEGKLKSVILGGTYRYSQKHIMELLGNKK